MRLGLATGLAALGSLITVGCNDSTVDACVAACDHGMTCAIAALIDAGSSYVADSGTFCQDSCASDVWYEIFPNTCKSSGAGYDCLAGLSCQDILSYDAPGGRPSPAWVSCAAKAECCPTVKQCGAYCCTNTQRCISGICQ